MATFKFKVPYSQRQVSIVDGTFDCEIEAESEMQALRIFHENRMSADLLTDGRRIIATEDNIEVIDAYNIEYEQEEITWE